ncbi:MAG: putative Ig domain-containing protein [Gammaproteobacteria bacterium]|nr:putative Ig domain-containing protein [Gammaproteobacteria bacterium]MDH4254912.1 putative Ig domain-containing protein [Gammaproteobacteria bacterium]MDH5309903.1 putative Ig domain-containing protein [Gammaproteobacteria bacterium]
MEGIVGRNRFVQFIAGMGVALALSGCLSSGEDTTENEAPPPPSGNAAPQITGIPSTTVKVGDIYTFTPNGMDPDGDALTFRIENMPGWASFDPATGALSGQPTLGDVRSYSSILISVSDGQASASLPRFAINVTQVGTFTTTLTWTPPTQNEDGSTLIDLAGYRIYWRTLPASGGYPNSVTINTPGIASYTVENLTAGSYEFVATAFNAAGVESSFSNTATRTF